jgi:hypothetical protein
MKKLSLVILVVASTFLRGKAQEIKVPVFVSGAEVIKATAFPQ